MQNPSVQKLELPIRVKAFTYLSQAEFVLLFWENFSCQISLIDAFRECLGHKLSQVIARYSVIRHMGINLKDKPLIIKLPFWVKAQLLYDRLSQVTKIISVLILKSILELFSQHDKSSSV